MASRSKKNKTDKKKHPGRGGSFLKKGTKIKRVSFYNSADHQELKQSIPHFTNVEEHPGIKCSFCKQKFTDLSELIKHLRETADEVHTKKKNKK